MFKTLPQTLVGGSTAADSFWVKLYLSRICEIDISASEGGSFLGTDCTPNGRLCESNLV